MTTIRNQLIAEGRLLLAAQILEVPADAPSPASIVRDLAGLASAAITGSPEDRAALSDLFGAIDQLKLAFEAGRPEAAERTSST